MKIKIVADSSTDLIDLEGVDFESVPLTILTDEKEYIDNESLDVDEMINDLREYKGKSSTSCPSTGLWLNSFEGYDVIYVVPLTSKISGAYNSAQVAKQMYLEKNPNAQIYVFDTLTTGPQLRLIVEKIASLVQEDKSFEEIVSITNEYINNTALYFSLDSIHNFAQNGRVSKLSEIATRLLNIKIVGKAQDGTLLVLNKCRGLKKALFTLTDYIKEVYKGGKIRIAHINCLDFANMVKNQIVTAFGNVDVIIYKARGLCSYYAEEGGLLIGFETC